MLKKIASTSKKYIQAQTLSRSSFSLFSSQKDSEGSDENREGNKKGSKKNQFQISPRLKNNFLKNVYGLEVQRHLFPSQQKQVLLNEEQIQFYRKTSPNYIVALVSKVINDAVNTVSLENEPNEQQKDQDQDLTSSSKNSLNPLQRFYQVGMYCRVKEYTERSVKLEGLSRCRIEHIERMELLKESASNTIEVAHFAQGSGENSHEQNVVETVTDAAENSQPAIEELSQEDDDQVHQTPSPSNSSQSSVNSFLHSSLQRPRNKNKNQANEVFLLKVKKLEEFPLMINSHIEIKFKYLINTFDMYSKIANPGHEYSMSIYNIEDILTILDRIAAECVDNDAKKDQVQKCLEAMELEDRIDCVQKLLQDRIHFSSYMKDIERAAQNSLRNKKFYEYYNEIMSIAKKVMDGKKAKQLFIEKCTKDFYDKNPTEEIIEVFETEKTKYMQTDQNSMQFGILKSYIEELSKIPYDIKSQEIFDLDRAAEVLDSEHYGMKDVKQAILEIIAVGKLKGSLKGKIFCLVGGPGLGKTTFAKSVAKALNRKFFNISLGGVSDSSVLKGHRRTYVGAYSGKIIEALKTCGTNNPVILLDEIDKMGRGNHGDPRSELLEILDPNQNSSFVDNFVDIKVDLSNVLFICSANYQQNISKPLMDRMDRIKLTSYTNDEKKQIFYRHLLGRAIDKSGIQKDQFILEDDVVDALVQDYCMGEPGVRYLEKNILSILEKIAYKIVTEEEPIPIKITKDNIKDFLGNTYYRQKDHTKISKGVAISLGGGDYGGRLTYIEAFKKSHISSVYRHNKRDVMWTGSLGDIFKEAMNISYSYSRNFLKDFLNNRFLYENQIHIHAPDGAQKKDGATDSLTISSALISLALQKETKKGVGLTGELTLHGKVLRTFGIKEKILVAKRQKLKEIILPSENYSEVEMLSPEIKEGIKFHFVKEYKEVYDILFC